MLLISIETREISVRNARSTRVLAEPSRKMSFRHLVGEGDPNNQHPAQFVSQARVVEVILYPICAQGRVVRQEARTRYTFEVDGIESEACVLVHEGTGTIVSSKTWDWHIRRPIEAPPVRSLTILFFSAWQRNKARFQQQQEETQNRASTSASDG